MSSNSRFTIPFDLDNAFEMALHKYLDALAPEAVRRILSQGATFKKFLVSQKLEVNGVDLNRHAIDSPTIGNIQVRFTSTHLLKEHGVSGVIFSGASQRPKTYIRAAYLRPMALHGFYLEAIYNGVEWGDVSGQQNTKRSESLEYPKPPSETPTIKNVDTSRQVVIKEAEPVKKSPALKLRGLVNHD